MGALAMVIQSPAECVTLSTACDLTKRSLGRVDAGRRCCWRESGTNFVTNLVPTYVESITSAIGQFRECPRNAELPVRRTS